MIIGTLTVKSNEFNIVQLPFLFITFIWHSSLILICGPTFFVISHQHCFKSSESQQDSTSDEDSNSVELSFTKVTTAYGFIYGIQDNNLYN